MTGPECFTHNVILIIQWQLRIPVKGPRTVLGDNMPDPGFGWLFKLCACVQVLHIKVFYRH